ncbi:beta-galactosidase [Mucilaginibacter sp. SMC90]|uniref:beta-galactosidase n=1 Tax=Mucilaginibacter sp. SMC90 TaxID=2929803 RepID=UPI001FB4B45D|nr:beta-galactosidase [Mucilaginibacter sp. SMC90]UOE47772.1 beta-galactosidase [Mucilaginibacter sp. SMC90]
MKKKVIHRIVYGLIMLGFCFSTNPVTAQLVEHPADEKHPEMYPAAPEASKSVRFDARGFLINGKRTFLASAGLEYARIPHQLWYDRLLRLKRDGFNCVEIYTFWNFHEPKEGQFEFRGDQDLDGFLKLVKKLGMYAIVRVGPYYCAEWNSGGYPIWLRFKDNVVVRADNSQFEKYVDRFFDKLMPIVSSNQINRGGSVVLVQLENEHPEGWENKSTNAYFLHLKNKALSLGLQVPYFFSGMHHGGDPAGDAPSLDDPGRPSPWMTTEFWSIWYSYYGSSQKDADLFGRRTWKIIAHGGNGYNYYMAHGGTNFAYFNDGGATSYDYGAAVGQTGDLRPMYYQFKRNALFATSFQDILENSKDSPLYRNLVTDTGLRVNTRHSESGDIIFLDHEKEGDAKASVHLPAPLGDVSLTLRPGEILPIVHHFKLNPGVTLDWAVTRILGISRQGATTTLVVYGPGGSQAGLQFSLQGKPSAVPGLKPLKITGKQAILNISFDANQPQTYGFKTGLNTIRVLAVNTALADRTWFLDDKGKNYVVTGPEYVSELSVQAKGGIKIGTEHFWKESQVYPSWIYGDGFSKVAAKADYRTDTLDKPFVKLAGWEYKSASIPATVDFDDSKWMKSGEAMEMGADGDVSANAWYRTTVDIKTPGIYKLNINSGGGQFIYFMDNKRVASGGMNEIPFNLTAGTHQLAIYAAHDGRGKLYRYIGLLKDVEKKGITGDVILHKGDAPYFVTGWRMIKPGTGQDGKVPPIPASFAAAIPYKTGEDAFKGLSGSAWFQAKINVSGGRKPVCFIFRSIDDQATVYVNGKKAAVQDQGDKPFTVPYDGSLDADGAVTITVFLENKSGPGGIDKPVEIIYTDDLFLKGWRMKGGPGNFESTSGWKTLDASAPFDRPYFYRSTFTINRKKASSYPIWRVTYQGLSRGFVFVNGHNLGGYPEGIPINSLYIPECWLKEGENAIVFYDQFGNRPDKVTILPEAVSSRALHVTNFK